MVLTSGGVTRLVDRLVEAGTVERVQCPTDRRVLWAQLTERGLEVVTEAAARHVVDVERHYTGEMSIEELEQVTRVLDRLAGSCEGPAQTSTSSMATSLDSVSSHSSSGSEPATIPHPA
jgi:DNA-binding MarR family transcriptional regulator